MKKNPDDIRELEAKIAQARKREESYRQTAKSSDYTGAAIGMRITVELVSGILVGGGIGYVLDKLLSTFPLFMVIFLLLGGAAGFLNVYRTAKNEENRKDVEE